MKNSSKARRSHCAHLREKIIPFLVPQKPCSNRTHPFSGYNLLHIKRYVIEGRHFCVGEIEFIRASHTRVRGSSVHLTHL